MVTDRQLLYNMAMEGVTSYLNAIVLLLVLTSFIKVLLSLSILRSGLGLHGGGVGIVVVGIALALSFFIMQPQIDELGGVEAIFSPQGVKAQVVQEKMRPFLERHSDLAIRTKMDKLQERLSTNPTPEKPSFSTLTTSFLVTELHHAFEIGVLILIPFVLIDLLIGNAMMLLGLTNISADVLALPCKLLLFFAVDGWTLIVEKLVGSYIA